ncbi:apolipoprotein N-acyltransferase, partial [Streptomyces toxytricini]
MSSSVTREPRTAGAEAGAGAGSPAARAAGAERSGRKAAAVRGLLAAGSGVLLYLSFPPRPLWWLAPVALAVLAGCIRGRRARAGFRLGLLH